MNDLRHIGKVAGDYQDAHEDELVDMVAARRRFLTASAARKPRMRRTLMGIAATLAVAAALFVVWFRPESEALSFRVGEQGRPGEVDAWLAAPADTSLPLQFSDGTAVVLEPSARARVTRLRSEGATLRLEAGRASLAVQKRKRAAWQVSLGPFRVDVTGTRFDIDWEPRGERLTLTMHEGSVVVSGCVLGSGRPFTAGETVQASCRDGRVEISTSRAAFASDQPAVESPPQPRLALPVGSSPVAAASAAVQADPVAALKLPEPSASTSPAGTAWRELARNGKHEQAFAAAESAGFAAECAAASAPDLVALGDSARYVGRLDRATEAYQAVRRRFPGHERAAVAAFALGRLAFDQRGAYADAGRWFRTYLNEQPNGRLARDAAGRLFESLDRSGERTRARAEAELYLERYPNGPHAEMARRLLQH